MAFTRRRAFSSLSSFRTFALFHRKCSHSSTYSYLSRMSSEAPDLIEWISKEGGFVHSALSIGSKAQCSSGLGIFASSHIPSDTLLISLPPHIPLRLHSSSLSASNGPDILIAELCNRLPEEVWSLKLGLKLLQERAKEDSFWWPYISNLPKTFNVPIFFKKEEVDALQYIPVIHQVNKRCKLLLHLENYIKLAFESLSPNQHPFGGQGVDAAALGWAMAAVSSRAFRLHDEQMSDGKRKGNPMLLPLIDMCNHSFLPNATIIQETISDCKDSLVKVVSKETIQEGSAIFLDYGPLSNDLLLLDYGFIIPQNIHDLVEIRYDKGLLSKAAETAGCSTASFTIPRAWQEELLNLLKLEGHQAVPKMDLGGKHLVDGRLLAALRILFADDLEVVKKHDLMSLQSLNQDAPLGVDNEIQVLQTITMLCAILLGCFETRIAEDVEFLGTPGISEAMKLAVSFRSAKKDVILHVMTGVTQKVNKLRKFQLRKSTR